MKIANLSTRVLRLPIENPVSDSIHRINHIEVVTCTVETETGLSGMGFTYTIGLGGHAIRSLIDRYIAPRVLRADAEQIGEVWNSMWKLTHSVGRGGISAHAMAAIDIGLWDLKGKGAGKPLHHLLGGRRKPIPLYDTDGGWLHFTVEELTENALDAVRRGFHGFKIKVGKEKLSEDVDRIKAVGSAVGDKIPLMIDANQVWDTAEALRRGVRFQELDLEWYEEPIPADDIWGHQRLSKHLSIPIAVGETMFTKYEFQDYMRLGCCQIVQADVCRVGGITEWLKIATMAEGYGLRMVPHFVMDLHVSLVASIQNGVYVEHIPWLRQIFKNPPEIADGNILPPDRPGTGLEVTPETLEKYSIR